MRVRDGEVGLQQARWQLLESGRCPRGVLDERLARSWQRSLKIGLRPGARCAVADNLEQRAVKALRERHHALLVHARPIMQYLCEQLRGSHNMVVLADPDAILVETLGDTDFLDRAARVALTTGALWSEQHRGTNGIGTALAEHSAIQVSGAEHYLERNSFMTCASAPIFSGAGQIVGIVDISGDHDSDAPPTLGLARTAAQMIENQLLIHDPHHHCLHLHAHRQGLGTVGEGIVQVADDGRIIGCNRAGLALLRLSLGDLGAAALETVLGLSLDDMLLRQHADRQGAQPVRLADDSLVFAHCVPLARRARSATITPAVRSDALARLDTGDPRWRKAGERVPKVLGKPIPVLIQGESGVGKEYFARAAHESGPRHQGPFVAINCAALPESLIESELFGYRPGAFTGGRREGHAGLLCQADGGTLFLGDMPLSLQTRLLRVLQEREVMPLGGGKAVRVDFALISASNRVLLDEVEQGRFRADLYYRINGLNIALPPLRERTDLDALIARMLDTLDPGRRLSLHPALREQLRRYPWPGNLRQLANVLQTACALLDADEECIRWQHLPEDVQAQLRTSATPVRPVSASVQSLRALSCAAIARAVDECRGNISQAARLLGISRQTIYRKLARERHHVCLT